jgi:ubiquinone/menaquinone biosynthesis C-methylase UbiE
MSNQNDYILGTDPEELQRLRFQHRVWSKDTFALWERAGIGQGQRFVDLGCGPGFATFDLADIAGADGMVIGLDKSAGYIASARSHAQAAGLSNLEFVLAEFGDMKFERGSLDAIYCRWAFAWINNVEEVLQRACTYLKRGGVFLSQEYLDWGTFRVVPERSEVLRVIDACRESWRVMDSEIDIAAQLPTLFRKNGFDVVHTAAISKLSRPGRMVWQWPASFLKIYSLKLVDMGLLRFEERDAFLKVWPEVEFNEDSMLIAPLMMEIIARKA